MVALALLLIPASRIAAVDGEFTGQIITGFRLVDVGGANRKFMEDINLEDGPRLFDLQFEFVPDEGIRSAVDRVKVDLDNYGGDPFEALRIGVRKHGAYKFNYKRTKSNYFYNDIIFQATPATDLSKAQPGDFHHFNFDRIQDSATLGIDLNQDVKATFGFDRFTKIGESTTSFDIARDEFEFDKVINESMNTYRGGIEYTLDKVTLVFEERIRDYENMVHMFLPGFSAGEDTEDDTSLDFWVQDQPYDYLSLEHTIRAMAHPNDRLDIGFAGVFQSLDLDATGAEQSQGISYDSTALVTDVTGAGEIDRSINLFDIDATYMISEMVTVTGGFRHQKLDQDGQFTWDGEANIGDWDIKTMGFDVGANIYLSQEVTAHGGILYEKRDVDIALTEAGTAHDPESEETKNTGYFAGAAWDPVPEFDLNFDLEINSFDDPFTMASPTDRKRYRLRAKYRLDNGLTINGAFLMKDYENGNSGWTADNQQINLGVGYQNKKGAFSFGYGMVSGERKINQLITGGSRSRTANIFYEIDSKFIDARASVKAHEKVSLGGSFRNYKNDGSFGLKRNDMRTWIDFNCPSGYLLHLGYHWVDFDETAEDFDDYDTNIGELSIGRTW
jgi:hypothetical protein